MPVPGLGYKANMEGERQTTEGVPADSTALASSFGATVLRVAWLAILLGLAMEVLLLLVTVVGFGTIPGLGPAVANLVRQVCWSTIVCVGLALGTVISQARVPLMGLLGLFAAPLAFIVSRSLHQVTIQTLDVADAASGSSSLYLIALLKGVEYMCLGMGLGWVGRRPWGGAVAHAAVGLAAGIFFGGAIVVLTDQTAPEPLATADLLSRALNEVIFPVGCSLLLFSAEALGKRLAG